MRQASMFKRMCVFCGSSQGNRSSYHDAAIDLTNQLIPNALTLNVRRPTGAWRMHGCNKQVGGGMDLVYGGGGIGIMGLMSGTDYL
ncbi:hypothetical protein ZWY2020_059943 [Hordeum vulgare]|nr:hypothetical protein ZWY2020_059943 [Hordeum vulgare]